MNLLSLPDELLLCITEMFEFTWDINSLAQVNYQLYTILNPLICRRNARYFNFSALHWAVKHGNEYTARKFLDEVAPEGIDNSYWDILESAALEGHDAIVRALLEKGVSPASYRGPYPTRPLEWAVQNGHEAVARTLLTHGVNVDALKQDDERFWSAAQRPGTLSMIKILVENVGYDPTRFPARSLMAAALYGRLDILEYLLQLGCDVNARHYCSSGEVKTAIYSAAQADKANTIRFLLEHGAEVSPMMLTNMLRIALWQHHRKSTKFLLEHVDLTTIPTTPIEQGTLLCAAAACGLEALARRLLEHGCFPDAEVPDCGELAEYDGSGCRASVWAASFGHAKVVELLLAYGADKQRPLLAAVRSQHTHVVKLLLAKGADPYYRQSKMLSSAVCHEDIFNLLLEYGVDPMAMEPEDSESLLISAIHWGQIEVVILLFDRGLKLDDPIEVLQLAVQRGPAMLKLLFQHGLVAPPGESPAGQQAVMRAINKRNVPLLKLLFDGGFRLSQGDHYSSVSAVLSAKYPESMLDLLLSHGMDINVQGRSGLGNILCACYTGCSESVIKLLLRKGADPLCQEGSNRTPLSSMACSRSAGGVEMILEEIGSCEHISPKELKGEIRKALSVLLRCEGNGYGEVGGVLQRFLYGELAGME